MATACAPLAAPAATRRGAPASASASAPRAAVPRAGAGLAVSHALRLSGRQAAPRPAGRAVRVVVRAAKSSSDAVPPPPPPPPPLSTEAFWGQQGITPTVMAAGETPPPGYIPYAGMPGQATPQMYPYGHPYYGAPVAPPAAAATSGGIPWMWVGVGVLVAFAFGQVTKWIKSKQAGFQQMMMQQVMKQMMNSAGGKNGMPGGMPGGMPPGAFPGAMGGMPPRAPSGMGGFGGAAAGASAAARSAPVDVTATPVKPAAAAAAAAPAAPAAEEAPKEARPHFQDVDVTAEAAAPAGGAGGPAPGGVSFEMMEQMLDNPEMLKMLYPTLPEAFRSPEKVKWLLSQPGAKQQMEAMLAGGTAGMPPVTADAIRNFDVNSPEVKAQFEQMGMTPEEMMTKVMSNPRLMELMMKPKVMAAIMDLQTNPANIQKYLNEPEVMGAFTELTELLGPPGASMPGMPPNFGA